MQRGSVIGSMIWTGVCRQANGSALCRRFHAFAQIPGNTGTFSGLIKNPKIDTQRGSSIFRCALSFRSFLHSGEQTEVEAEKNPISLGHEQVLAQESGNVVNKQFPLERGVGSNLRSMGFDPVLNRERRTRVNTRAPLENEAGNTPMTMVQGILRGSGVTGGPPLHHQQLESNADIVHIKLMRNNSYVTLTDAKGNRKMSVSAGQVAAKGDKPGRYSGEAASEYMGRLVKQMKIRSVVVKVSGFTFFRRKKDAILAFKDGYTHSRGDVNPIVYIEDTTRKPHNGCRLPKSRRI